LVEQEKDFKEAEILISDSIANFKTVASIANHHILVDKFDAINGERNRSEARTANCEGI